MTRWLLMGAGEAIVWLALVDVFMTVLYARVGTSIVAGRVAAWEWRTFRWVSMLAGRRGDTVLTFAGPVILLSILMCWSWMLNSGTALIVWPNLGGGIKNTSGPTDTSFLTALYAAGISLSVVGSSNFTPQTTGFRMLYLFNSVVGTSVISLTLTYLMQVYNALQRREAVALRVHLSTGETGDAADMVAGLGPRGDFSPGYSRLSQFAGDFSSLRASYDLYPVLLYFRYKQASHSTPRLILMAMDTATLIRAGLDDEKLGWLKESAAVEELWRGCMRVTVDLAEAFLPKGYEKLAVRQPGEADVARWRERYRVALGRMRQVRVPTIRDERAGEEAYVSQRARWDAYVGAFAAYMAYDVTAVDPVGTDPRRALGHEPLDVRLRSTA